MNKERLELMRKEKMEQMKELGRGGLSRGFSMLREKANTALANGAVSGGFAAIGGATTTADEAEDVGSEAAAGKPSYDDLVSLSMKLTRQNKLMKAQFQKMQARIAELQADGRVLTAFVSDVVGVDVDACLRTKSVNTEDADDDNAAATIDAKQLRERFEIVDALKQKALKTQLEQLKAQLDAKPNTQANVSLLPMSPAIGGQAPPQHAFAVPQYEEIDLLGDAFNSPVAQPAQQTNAFTADLLSLDMPTVAAASPTTTSTVLEQQLDEATEQLRRMEEKMKISAAENEELRRKSNELWQQRTAQVEELSAEKALLEKRLEEAEDRSRTVEKHKAELETRIADLEARAQTAIGSSTAADVDIIQEELQNAVTQKNDLEKQLQSLEATLAEKTATIDALKASIEALDQEKQALVAQVSASSSDDAPVRDELMNAVAQKNDLEKQLQSLEATLAEKTATIDALKASIEALDQEKQALVAQVSASSSDDAPVRDELMNAVAQKNDLEKQLQSLEATLAEKTATIDALKASIEALDQEKQALVAQVSASSSDDAPVRDELMNAVAQKNDLEKQLQSLEATLAEKTATIDALKASIEALDQEKQALVAQVSASSSDDVSASAETARSEVLHLRERVLELEMEVEQLQQAKITELERTSGEFAAMLEELERVKLARAEADHTVKSLHEKLGASDTRLSKALNEVEQNVAIIEALRAEIGHYTSEMKRIEAEHAASAEVIKQLEAERDRLVESKEAVEEQLEVLRANNSSNLESVVNELAEAKKQVAEQREYMNGKIEVLVKELDSARKHCEALEVDLAEKEKQNKKMASSQTAMTNEVMELQKQMSAMEQDLQMAAEGMEAHANKADESEFQRKETEEKLKNARGQIDALKDQHLKDLEMFRSEKEGELDRVRQEKSQLLKKTSEIEAAYESVTLKCSNLQDELEQERKRSGELEARLGQLTAEVGNMSIDLAETKKALSDRMALATRLQTENMGFAEKQAEQAARVESALRDASASKEQIAIMEAKVQDAHAEAERFKAERERAHREMESLKEFMESERRSMQQQLETSEAKHKTALMSEKDAFRRELERVESESKHKSKLALHAVLEKEAEIERLSKRLAELEEDVRSGDADNRKIFEFAQLQASREMEARANAARIHELTHELNVANAKVQELLQEQARHGEELTAMMQTQRREGVNMEYLKNVIVQFMSFKPGSSQQLRLVPVITTLLQFTPADMKEIKKATGRRSSWATWGAEKLEYKPIAGVPSLAPEAPAPQMRRTSPPARSSDFPRTDPTARASSFTLPPHDESGRSAHHATGESADF